MFHEVSLPSERGKSVTEDKRSDSIPDWIKREKQKLDQEDANEAEAHKDAMRRGLLVNELRPVFWTALLAQLKKNAEALKHIGLKGDYGETGFGNVRITVTKPGNFPNITYTDIFQDDAHIRCTTLGDGAYNLDFHAGDEEIGVINLADATPFMSAAQAADYVVQRMVAVIKRQV
jgi:hypothetical protein